MSAKPVSIDRSALTLGSRGLRGQGRGVGRCWPHKGAGWRGWVLGTVPRWLGWGEASPGSLAEAALPTLPWLWAAPCGWCVHPLALLLHGCRGWGGPPVLRARSVHPLARAPLTGDGAAGSCDLLCAWGDEGKAGPLGSFLLTWKNRTGILWA